MDERETTESSPDWTFKTFAVDLLEPGQFKSTVAILYVILVASLWKVSYVGEWFLEFGNRYLAGTQNILFSFVFFALVPMGIVRFVFRESLRDYGVTLGSTTRTIRTACILCPILIGVGYLAGGDKTYLAVYPLNPLVRPGVGETVFIPHCVTLFLHYVGWEFLFRGFLQGATQSRIGPCNAILLQTVASTMLHYGHPGAEVFGAILGGLFWGWLVYRTGSIFSGYLQHTVLGISVDTALIFGSLTE